MLLDELLSAVHSVLLDDVLVVTLVVLACVVEADSYISMLTLMRWLIVL